MDIRAWLSASGSARPLLIDPGVACSLRSHFTPGYLMAAPPALLLASLCELSPFGPAMIMIRYFFGMLRQRFRRSGL